MDIEEIKRVIIIMQSDLERVKDDNARLLKYEKEIHDIRIMIGKMEMVDNNIFSKLDDIAKSVEYHKKNFEKHDEKEMQKYSAIDKRLARLEKVLYFAVGAGMLFQVLNQLHLLKIGG